MTSSGLADLLIDRIARPMAPYRLSVTLLVLVGSGISSAAFSADAPPSSRKVWAELMGPWRMTGQPRRGSSAGAWTSEAKAAWIGEGAATSLEIRVAADPKSKRWIIGIDPQTGNADSVTLEFADAKGRTLKREPGDSEDQFRFVDDGSRTEDSFRLTLLRKSRDRWTGLLETKKPQATAWSRVQEYGLTRQGTTIAFGSGQRECVVTGGLGDIAVTLNGKTVYVCCSGCREALLADPDAFLNAKPSTEETGQDGTKNP